MIQVPAWVMLVGLAVVSALGLAFRTWLRSFVEAKVKEGTDSRVEALRSELRNAEERLKSDLRSKEAEIAALRDGVLSGRANRTALVDQKRLDANDRLWIAITKLSRLKGPAMSLSMLKLEAVSARVPNDPKLREVIKMMMLVENFQDSMKEITTDELKPYLSEIAWANYSAYASIIMGAWAVMNMLSIGVEKVQDFVKLEHTRGVLKAVLPHRSSAIDSVGMTGYFHFLDEIEQALLNEIRRELDGERADADSIEKAARIMDAVKKVQQDTDAMVNATATADRPVT